VIVSKRKLLLSPASQDDHSSRNRSLLTLIGLNVEALRASMSMVERASITKAFNNPASDLEIWIVTFATCWVGLNIQKV
jgi:hypothetical protein